MALYLRLFHGRKPKDQDLDDWGSDGPIFGPLAYVHTTYAAHIHTAPQHQEGEDYEDLIIDEDLVYYDGVWYGDWSVFDDYGMRDHHPEKPVPIDATKARIPDVQPLPHGDCKRCATPLILENGRKKCMCD